MVVLEHSGGVTICAVYPHRPNREPNECAPGEGGRNSVQNNDVSVEWEVQVPRGVNLTARTINGGILGCDASEGNPADGYRSFIETYGRAYTEQVETFHHGEDDEEFHLLVSPRSRPTHQGYGSNVHYITFPWSNESPSKRTLTEHLYSPLRLPRAKIDVFSTLFAPIVKPAPALVVGPLAGLRPLEPGRDQRCPAPADAGQGRIGIES